MCQGKRDLLAVGGGEIKVGGALAAGRTQHEKTWERFSVGAAQVAGIGHDERRLRGDRRNLNKAEGRGGFRIKTAGARKPLLFLVMPDRRGQCRARFAGRFPKK
jgi:hypothetical protein